MQWLAESQGEVKYREEMSRSETAASGSHMVETLAPGETKIV